MKVHRGRTAISVAFVASVAAGGLVATPANVAFAAASFTAVPERLYMAPEGTTLVAGLLGVPIAHMAFDANTDVISGDARTITVDTPNGPLGCDTMTDKPVGQIDYDIDDCSRIQMDVSHGRMFMGTATKIFRDYVSDPDGAGPINAGDDNPNDFVWRLPSGAIMDQFTGPDANEPNGHKLIHIVGTKDQLNAALAALVYTPDDGYYYVGSFNPETLHMVLVPGDPAETPPDAKDVQIRVLDVNDFPSHDGPDSKSAQAQIELVMHDEFTVADEDNDEDVDGAQADPPVAEDPLPDGENTSMLLVGWLTCGQAIDPGTGFHLGSSIFQLDDPSLDDLLVDILQPAGAPDTFVQAALAALEAIKPGLSTLTFATSQPTTYTTAFGGISTMSEVQDALSEVTFLHNKPNDTCTLVTVVSDLGNNGLPIQYVGSPPTGVEIPFIGFDWNVLTITTGDLDEIHVDFDPTPLLFDESAAPDAAIAELHISPATHPEFTIKWDAVPRLTDPPPGPGVATPNVDFTGTFNNTLTIPANATVIPIEGEPLPSPVGTNVLPDNVDEGNETFQYVLDLSPAPPPGWVITSDTDTRTVIIVDDDDAAAELDTVSNPTVVEGDSGTKQMQFVLMLSKPADGNEQVQVDTADGTATVADNDYEPIAGQMVTFAPGATTATVNVTVNGDLTDEPDETLTLLLSNANIALHDTAGTGTIQNDDQQRVISIADAQQLEGDAGLVQIVFTVSITPAAKGIETAAAATFQLATPNAATQGTDYGALIAEPITFASGATTTTVSVTIIPDTDPEPDEDFQIVLMTPQNATLGDDTAIGTIVNDDGIPSVSVDDVTVQEGDAPSTINASFTVSLSDPAIGGEKITVDAAGATATEGVDFATFNPQELTFAAGETEKVVVVTVNGDDDAEPDELFVLNLSLASGLLVADSAGVGTITNDDISISLNPTASVTEGGTASLTLTIEPPLHPSFTVQFDTSDLTATGGVDYVEQAMPVIVPADAPSLPLSIPTIDDPEFEGPETLAATIAPLASPSGFTVRASGLASSIVTIDDDDPEPLMSIANVNVIEGDTAHVTVSLANPSHPCTAAYATADGSATVADSDYTATSGTVSFGGLPSTTIDVDTADDADIEGAETFTVALSAPGGDPLCGIGQSVATVTIIDNDDPNPSLSIADASIIEGTGAGTTTIAFDVTTSGVQPDDCGYRVVLAHVTTDDDDFTSPATFDQTGTFLATDLTVTREFGITRDSLDEPDETFTVTLTGDGPTPCEIGDGTATGTIIDDDAPPVDTTPPAVTVTLVGADPTSTPAIDFTVQFSEAVTGFTAGDVTLGGSALPTNAMLATVDADTYTVTVSGMSVSGTVTVSVGAAVAEDLAGNDNTASNVASVQWNKPVVQDTMAPSVTVTAGVASPTSNAPVPFTVQFSEAMTGFTAGDVVLSAPPGASVGITPVDSDTYIVTVDNLLASGTVSVSVPAGAAQDAALNVNTASNTASVVFVLASGPLALHLPSNIVENNDPGKAGAVVAFTASASGGAPPVVVMCAPASGSFFALGTTTVNCTATDADEGLDQAIVSGSFTVQVIDNEPPTIADLPDLARATTDTTPVAVTFPLPAASDNSGVAPTVVCTPASGTSFPVGVTTVTCTATDGAGNAAASSFTVTVTSTPSGPPVTTPGALPPTGSSSRDTLRLATLLVTAGLGLLLAGARRRQSRRASA